MASVKYIESNINISSKFSIEDTAKIVSKTLNISLSFNDSGKYEEFIGYDETVLGIKISLISNPNDLICGYDLTFYGKANGNEVCGVADITDYILSLLEKTELECRKMD
ncbi:hypothetical protein [Vibrio nitrifigilis]|uniref:Uncharacterized protein n=1 Tax=Vibrio nitrifigilis TaxID=2789781 RepID=A0ABS0GLY0_9VIBR|nr:hypothetical protein [Vibrio nitrifigilis]MBF9003320.1 hypothetical protein [Vibrio nitrifigilis]